MYGSNRGNKCQKHEGGKREGVCTKNWRTSPEGGGWLAAPTVGQPSRLGTEATATRPAGSWVKGRSSGAWGLSIEKFQIDFKLENTMI